MSNALSTISDAFSPEIAALLGQNINGGGNILPRLAPNADHVVEIDGQEYSVPAGAFKVRDEAGNTVYSRKVTFRPIMQRFHWAKYDEKGNDGKGGYVAYSLYVPDHKTDPLDDQGGIACGKLRGKAARDEANLSEAQKAVQKAVQSFRLVWGLVTLTGTTATGQEVTLTDYPVELRCRGVNYMPFSEQVEDKLTRAKRMLPQAELNLSTTRHKKGQTTYYVIGYEMDPTKVLPITPSVVEAIQKFAEHAKVWNEGIMEKHKAARAKTVDAPFDTDAGLEGDWANGGTDIED